MQWVWAFRLTVPLLQVRAKPPLTHLCRLTARVDSRLLRLHKSSRMWYSCSIATAAPAWPTRAACKTDTTRWEVLQLQNRCWRRHLIELRQNFLLRCSGLSGKIQVRPGVSPLAGRRQPGSSRPRPDLPALGQKRWQAWEMAFGAAVISHRHTTPYPSTGGPGSLCFACWHSPWLRPAWQPHDRGLPILLMEIFHGALDPASLRRNALLPHQCKERRPAEGSSAFPPTAVLAPRHRSQTGSPGSC